MIKNEMKLIKTIIAIFMVVGIIMAVVFTVILVRDIQFKQTAQQTTATITSIETYRDSDGDTSHEVYINYEVNGRQYSNIRLSTYIAGMHEGQEITIYYDSDNPTRISLGGVGSTVAMAAFLIIPIVFILIGVVPLIVIAKKRWRKQRLITQGKRLPAIIVGTDPGTVTMNGRSSNVLVCEYIDSNQHRHLFRSGNLWHDDTTLNAAIGKEINVYVDGDDFSKYIVDDSVLTKNVTHW
jgi:uncharacterized membrane protein